LRFCDAVGLSRSVYSHISDEPRLEDLPSYKAFSDIMLPLLKGYPVIDAMSNPDFFDAGVVKTPVPASEEIEAFMAKPIAERWTYFCCAQYKSSPNRFFSMPSARNRVLGWLLFAYDIGGFLHWGYNFWLDCDSGRLLDPWGINEDAQEFIGGDAFLVYPGEDQRPLPSIRQMVLHEALCDLRALRTLEAFIGRDEVLERMRDWLGMSLSFSSYPLDPETLLAARRKLNAALVEEESRR
jgi:hypothetical protein